MEKTLRKNFFEGDEIVFTERICSNSVLTPVLAQVLEHLKAKKRSSAGTQTLLADPLTLSSKRVGKGLTQLALQTIALHC